MDGLTWDSARERQLQRLEEEAIGRLMTFVGSFIASKPDHECGDAATAVLKALKRVSQVTEKILIAESRR